MYAARKSGHQKLNDNQKLSDKTLQKLQEELTLLRGLYGQSLKQESVKESVALLEKWVSGYREGDSDSEECLRHYGKELLEDVTTRLKTANEDIARMDDESPAAKNFSGKEAHRISNAVRLAADSQKKLKATLH